MSLLPHCSQESNVGHQQLYWGHLRKFREGSHSCQVCSNRRGLSRNTASIWATSVSVSTWRMLALLNRTNWSSLNRSFSTSTLCRNNTSSLHIKWKFKNSPRPTQKKSMSALDAQPREDFLSPEVIFLAVGGAFLNEPRSLGKGSSYSSGETYTDIGGFPGSSAGKELACNAGDLGSVPGLGRSPGREHDNPLWYSCLKNPHGQRSLVGYSPWGCKESDTMEQLRTAQHMLHWTPLMKAGQGFPGRQTWEAGETNGRESPALQNPSNVSLRQHSYTEDFIKLDGEL